MDTVVHMYVLHKKSLNFTVSNQSVDEHCKKFQADNTVLLLTACTCHYATGIFNLQVRWNSYARM